MEYIEGKIESGEWEQGYQLPSETSLAQFFKVSRATVRQAISELVQKGRVIRKGITGTVQLSHQLNFAGIFTG